MKPSLFTINLFYKYRDRIEEHNTKGIFAGGILFFVCLLTDFIGRFIVKPESINWFFGFYFLIDVVCLAAFKTLLGKVRHLVEMMTALLYGVGFLVVCHIQLLHTDELSIFSYATIAIPLSMLVLAEPFSLVFGQFLGAVAVGASSYFARNRELDSFDVARIAIICLVAIIFGLISSYIRIENIMFDSEVSFFTDGEDDDFVAEYSDAYWSGKNKYGILTGELAAKRRVFAFIFNMTKDKLSNIRENNIFGLKEGMSWEEVKSFVLGRVIDPLSKQRLSRFMDMDMVTQSYKAGKRRFATIAGFWVNETESVWLDIECIIKTHPLTGELLASIVCEDVSEERILMGVLNKIVEQNYDYVMCVERKLNRTITFSVKQGQEIRGTYGDTYEEETSAYIKNDVDEHDVKRAFELMDMTVVERGIAESGMHEFLLDEVDSDKMTHKKLFQYSYMDPGHKFMCVIKQDVTEVIRKEDDAKNRLAEALREKEIAMNARSEFMTRMSHEMRTPMNAILGLSSLMKDEIFNPEALQDYLSKIEYSGKFLLQLINDILDMSKMEQEKFRIKPVPYSYAEFWESIDMMIGPMCLKKGLDFEWKSSIPGDCSFLADPLRLTQIFINLLSNSVKYTRPGGHISFECKETKRDENRVFNSFIVKDDGIGMSEEFQKHLFEPFAQESKDINSDLNGTGLGLAIVKGIVDALDGTILVESRSGEGTTFEVNLSFELCESKEKKKLNIEEINLEGKKILVVEDNDINREIAEAILQKKGIVTETAVNGLEAVEKFSSHIPGYYDLILMDIRMPVMSGLTATKRIRAMDRDDASQIPIIAMTANAFSKDVQASFDAGINEHLSKPIEPKLLYETIGRFLQ